MALRRRGGVVPSRSDERAPRRWAVHLGGHAWRSAEDAVGDGFTPPTTTTTSERIAEDATQSASDRSGGSQSASPARLADEPMGEFPPITGAVLLRDIASEAPRAFDVRACEASPRAGAAVPGVDGVSGGTGTILTLVQVIRRALIENYKRVLKEVGRGHAWSVCGVAASVVSLLEAWEVSETLSQWATVMRMCGYAQQAV